MKKFESLGLFMLNYLPLMSCFIYKFGVGSYFTAMGLFFVALIMSYKYSDKLSLLIFNYANGILSTALSIHINTQLYVHKVTWPTEYGTLLIGKIFIVISLVITTVSSLLFVIKYKRNKK